MKFIKIVLIILYIPLSLLLLVVIIGLIDRFSSPGQKSISNLDLQQLVIVIAINLILIISVLAVKKLIKKQQGKL